MKSNTRLSARRIALLGMLAALTAALSILESWLPSLPIPGARLGLANVVITAAMWIESPLAGVLLALCKVGMAFLTRGATAAFMAFGGTALAVAITAALIPLIRRERLTFVGVSVSAAMMHTMGQLACAAVVMSASVWSYAPLLLVVSTVSGTVTGLVLNLLVSRFSEWEASQFRYPRNQERM